MPAKSDSQNLPPDQKHQLTEWDRRCVWHPFTQHSLWNVAEPLIIVGGEGEYLLDADGNRYIDGHSSLWCNVHGHRRPEINGAIIKQLDRIAHSTQLGLASPPAIRLAKRLIDIAPPGLTKVFYSDDGSTSVEVAAKMAYGYWHHNGRPQRSRFIALRNAYHGDTIGAVSLGGIDLFHRVYSPMLFKTEFAPSPYCYRCPLGKCRDTCNLACADEIGRLLSEYRGQVAAVVVEPLIQCAAGMITAPQGHLRRVRELCDRHDVLLIADEVATGMGRTGRMFACEHENVAPDLMCVSKGLTGGYLPLAATLASERIYEAFLGPIDSGRTFYHGHTFTGNPLGCVAALANLDIFESDRTLEQLPPKIERLAEHLRRLADNPHVGDVRQCGMIAGIELVKDKSTREQYPYGMQVGAQVCAHARQYGVIIRPLADVIVIMPPLVISAENIDHLMNTVERCITEVVPRVQTGVGDGLE
ncbi:MAG TPA: adenosylmethionine--8-amino-7-oxononanoate transaminase [Phycisphaerae bacterium]|nr:adenosylmethionine--8-amino-7-oxononanoate transaminase [Phycisphaerae bacterium]HRR83381.1 adenosylmethionine--8-amino-7-oxononanoate transaminase [Phycisphaerae bacterium]